MYHKDFVGRGNEKIKIHNRSDSKKYFIRPREIWYATLGINIGNETDGKTNYQRPVLILSKVGSVFRVLPMTTKGKKDNSFYHLLTSYDFGKDSYVILSQIRTLDQKRLQYRVATISITEFSHIKKSLLQWLV